MSKKESKKANTRPIHHSMTDITWVMRAQHPCVCVCVVISFPSLNINVKDTAAILFKYKRLLLLQTNGIIVMRTGYVRHIFQRHQPLQISMSKIWLVPILFFIHVYIS
jgi:hypothetical protein